ncbi:MAG: hypothetical protein MZV64_73760 [Ignavibacteriales bacterium]|nr:hypothetical protein [Ignavibacteriales bacterium]
MFPQDSTHLLDRLRRSAEPEWPEVDDQLGRHAVQVRAGVRHDSIGVLLERPVSLHGNDGVPGDAGGQGGRRQRRDQGASRRHARSTLLDLVDRDDRRPTGGSRSPDRLRSRSRTWPGIRTKRADWWASQFPAT